MTDRCDSLHAYVDGELGEDKSAEFESHLASCATCIAELPRLLELLAALDDAAELAARGKPASARLTVIPGGRAGQAPASEAAAPEAASPEAAAPEVPARETPAPEAHAGEAAAPGTTALRPARRKRTWWIAAGAPAAAAAAVLLWLGRTPPTPAPPGPDLASIEPALGPKRLLEARLDYSGAERFRPLDVQRGAESSASASDRLIQLQLSYAQAKNWHGVAVAALLAGDRERARQAFVRAPGTPEVDADRAALELLDGSRPALEHGLDEVDRALAAKPSLPAAVWNRALILAALDLPLAAAREFDRIRALGEPGWAEEAGQRTAALRQAVAARRELWKRATEAKRPLIVDAQPVPAQVAQVTGYMTLVLYDAVRAAPSRAAVEALLPLARTLDAAYRSDHLTTYVRRISASDFGIRKPLADTYRQLLFGPAMSAAEIDAFLRQLERAGADDIRLGALVRVHRVAEQLDTYRKLAAATGDPWFAAIAEQETAAAEMSHGNGTAAERRLRGAIEAAERERLTYRAIALREQLVKLYKAEQHLAQAAEVARIEFHDAIAAGEGLSEMNALSDLVAINQNRYASGLFRAYVTEQLERSQTTAAVGPSPYDEEHDCATRQYDFQSLANLSLEAFDPDTARTWLMRAPTCTKAFATELMFQRAVYAADLYRLGRSGGDAQLTRDSLAALRRATLSPGEQAMVEYIEGSLVVDDDRAASERHLRDAIARADHRSDAAHFYVKARAYSSALLATSTGRAGDFAKVLDLLAEDLEIPRPPRCAVAIARYAERTVVAFSDTRGEIGGQYAADRTSTDLDAATLIPPAAADRLRACERVVVLARAPVLGASRLLPPELAWSYALKGSTVTPPTTQASRLVIANPEAPPDLQLPPLGPYPDEASRGAAVLRGADATPSRALQAMRDAQVIEFHTHGFIGNDVTEPSYLVLSPELDRQYALTAADVAEVKLAGAPLVILGACHAAASSRSLEGGIGLAEAFLRSGARAVVASPDAVGDLGAPAFFAAVRERVLQGADPAVAVRDERLHRLAVSHDDAWVSGVVVFETLGNASM